MEHTKISIIVPIYNAEQLIYKCVDSILSANSGGRWFNGQKWDDL